MTNVLNFGAPFQGGPRNIFGAMFAILLLFCCACGVSGARDKQKQSTTCGVPQVIPGDVRTVTPWSAAIFISQGKGKPPKFFTNGVVIGPTTIVSVAGGPYATVPRGSKSPNYTVPSAELFLVGTGINSSDFSTHDSFAQFSKVTFIEPYTNDDYSNEYYHYFMYHLKTPLNFGTPYVKEICIPLILKNRSQSPYGWQLVQAGFAAPGIGGTTSPVLKAWKVTTGPLKLCQSAARYHYKRELEKMHAFCSRRDVVSTKRGTPFANIVNSVDLGVKDNDLCHMHGASLAFEIGNSWYLATMVSLLPGRSRGRCNHKSIYMYGNFVKSLDWAFGSYTCSPNKFACSDRSCILLGSVCNNVVDCADGGDEDPVFCAAQNICKQGRSGNFSCGVGQGCIVDTLKCDGKPDCPNQSDESPKLCQNAGKSGQLARTAGTSAGKNRRKSCPEIPIYEGMVATCFDTDSNEKVDCAGATFPGARMKVECDKYSDPHFGYDHIDMTCNLDGEWQGQKPFSCDQVCGIIREGQFSSDLLPWQALIYTSTHQGGHEPFCSATLIEKSFLLTSASCVNSWVTNPGERELFKVLLNPVSTKVTFNVQSPAAQIFPVKQVWFPEPGASAETIAMIELQNPAHINGENKPTPACYIQSFRKLKPGKIGLVSGFGIQDGILADPIKVLNTTVVSNEECENAGVTIRSVKDEFCAQGASFCGADVGGGFFSLEKVGNKTAYMLKGISTPPASPETCPGIKYQRFTSIDLYSDWILDILESYS